MLARRGLYGTDPNPRVGCTLVHKGEIVGEGWHQRAGEPHAEVNALRSVGPGQCKFLAVTLLPCRSCMTFIASKGIKRIVFRDVYERDKLAFTLAKEFGIELVHIPRAGQAKKTRR